MYTKLSLGGGVPVCLSRVRVYKELDPPPRPHREKMGRLKKCLLQNPVCPKVRPSYSHRNASRAIHDLVGRAVVADNPQLFQSCRANPRRKRLSPGPARVS